MRTHRGDELKLQSGPNVNGRDPDAHKHEVPCAVPWPARRRCSCRPTGRERARTASLSPPRLRAVVLPYHATWCFKTRHADSEILRISDSVRFCVWSSRIRTDRQHTDHCTVTLRTAERGRETRRCAGDSDWSYRGKLERRSLHYQSSSLAFFFFLPWPALAFATSLGFFTARWRGFDPDVSKRGMGKQGEAGCE